MIGEPIVLSVHSTVNGLALDSGIAVTFDPVSGTRSSCEVRSDLMSRKLTAMVWKFSDFLVCFRGLDAAMGGQPVIVVSLRSPWTVREPINP